MLASTAFTGGQRGVDISEKEDEGLHSNSQAEGVKTGAAFSYLSETEQTAPQSTCKHESSFSTSEKATKMKGGTTGEVQNNSKKKESYCCIE